MSISDRCETGKISSLVGRHVPKAKLSQQNEAELTFTLPFESMDTFPGKYQTVFMGEREEYLWDSNHCHLIWVKFRSCFTRLVVSKNPNLQAVFNESQMLKCKFRNV